MNSINDDQATFEFDTNKIRIINKNFSRKDFPLKLKILVARDIVQEIALLTYQNEQYYQRAYNNTYERMYW